MSVKYIKAFRAPSLQSSENRCRTLSSNCLQDSDFQCGKQPESLEAQRPHSPGQSPSQAQTRGEGGGLPQEGVKNWGPELSQAPPLVGTDLHVGEGQGPSPRDPAVRKEARIQKTPRRTTIYPGGQPHFSAEGWIKNKMAASCCAQGC